MISQLRGIVSYKNENFIIMDTGGVGYKIFLPSALCVLVEKDKELFLWTHLAVRENAMELYGFASKPELDFFEMLINISGIGPKSALAILNLAPLELLTKAVRTGDTHYLTKVSGIGEKTAGKIILELKEKFGDTGKEEDSLSLKEDIDTLEALKSMGYSAEDARDTLKQVSDNAHGMHDKIKAALRLLAKR